MSRWLRAIVAVVTAAVCTGCMEVATVVTVKPDGSGTITQTVLLKDTVVEQMKAMAGAMGGSADISSEFKLYDEDKLRAKAEDMGEGVSFVSAKAVTEKGKTGHRAEFAFTDISKVRINQNPSDSAPGNSGPPDPAKREFITFQFKRGDPAVLEIAMPSDGGEPGQPGGDRQEPVSEPALPDDASVDAAMAQLKQVYDGMRLAVSVQVEGEIVESNATHRRGSTVTLFEMDFARLIDNADQFRKFSAANPKTVEEAKDLMKGIEGMKVELNDRVRIAFH